MAGNVKTGNPWILDTAEEVVAKGTIVRIKAIKFVGTTDEDTCTLHNGDGKVIWVGQLSTVATSSKVQSDFFGDRGFASNGLTVATLDHGLCYVYLADTK